MSDDESENDYDTTVREEQTEKGYRLTVKSKRGTGTNDRDEVKAELLAEERVDRSEQQQVVGDVTSAMNQVRMNQPEELE